MASGLGFRSNASKSPLATCPGYLGLLLYGLINQRVYCMREKCGGTRFIAPWTTCEFHVPDDIATSTNQIFNVLDTHIVVFCSSSEAYSPRWKSISSLSVFVDFLPQPQFLVTALVRGATTPLTFQFLEKSSGPFLIIVGFG